VYKEDPWGIDTKVISASIERLDSILLLIGSGNEVKPGCGVWGIPSKLVTGQGTKVH